MNSWKTGRMVPCPVMASNSGCSAVDAVELLVYLDKRGFDRPFIFFRGPPQARLRVCYLEEINPLTAWASFE